MLIEYLVQRKKKKSPPATPVPRWLDSPGAKDMFALGKQGVPVPAVCKSVPCERHSRLPSIAAAVGSVDLGWGCHRTRQTLGRGPTQGVGPGGLTVPRVPSALPSPWLLPCETGWQRSTHLSGKPRGCPEIVPRAARRARTLTNAGATCETLVFILIFSHHCHSYALAAILVFPRE